MPKVIFMNARIPKVGLATFKTFNSNSIHHSFFSLLTDMNYKERYLRFRRILIVHLLFSVIAFVILFLYLSNLHFKEIIDLQDMFIRMHNRDLDKIIDSVNRFRLGPMRVN